MNYYATLALRVLPTVTSLWICKLDGAQYSITVYKKNLKLILKTVFRKFPLSKFRLYGMLYDAYSESIVAVDSRKFMVVV